MSRREKPGRGKKQVRSSGQPPEDDAGRGEHAKRQLLEVYLLLAIGDAQRQ